MSNRRRRILPLKPQRTLAVEDFGSNGSILLAEHFALEYARLLYETHRAVIEKYHWHLDFATPPQEVAEENCREVIDRGLIVLALNHRPVFDLITDNGDVSEKLEVIGRAANRISDALGLTVGRTKVDGGFAVTLD